MTSEIVKEYGRNAGADVVGIAASGDFVLAPDGFKPTDVLEGCRSVVVLGCAVPQEAILGDPIGFIDIRNAINAKVNAIAKDVAKQVKRGGYAARDIGGMAGKSVDGMTHGHISLKHAAELAGLGVIGRNYLLNNPEHGNLLWFSAVLTDADLIPDPKLPNSFCDDCNICVEQCPSGALDNPNSFGKKSCSGTMFKMENKKWEIKCFLCRKVCPHRFGR